MTRAADAAGRRRAAAARTLALAAACLTSAGAAPALGAQAAPGACAAPALGTGAAAEPRPWSPPLDRRVALAARDVTLRAALDDLAARAGLRLSYSADLLPLDRCVRLARTAAAGDLLAALLDGVAVEPVVAGPAEVVLAPVRAGRRPVAATLRSTVLDRIVVTGRTDAAAQRSRTTAVDVLTGDDLARRGGGSLADALDAGVPGVWAWTQSPASLTARYGSIRGASSFGASYPKVYVDGIEVANPLLVTHLTPESIERVEVIRGPQGAALYGADAISGVVNIVTRHDGVYDGTPALALRSRAGVAGSDYAATATPTQEHAATWHAGSGARTATAGVSAAAVGAFVPGAESRSLSANAGVRLAGTRATVTATGRLYVARAGAGASLVGDSVRAAPYGDRDREPRYDHAMDDPAQRLTAYTLGTRATVAAGSRWTHAVVLGLDGYRLSGLADAGALVPFAADTAAQSATGGGDRLTARLSSVAQLVTRQEATAALTLSAEQSTLRQRYAPSGRSDRGGMGPRLWDRSVGALAPYVPGPARRSFTESLVEWRSSTGVTAQMDASLRGALYATGGVRLEHDVALRDFGASSIVALPMLGVAAVRGRGPVTAKLRAAYGRGIRSPRGATRETLVAGATGELSALLRPEQQSGTEVGVDVVVGRALTLQATRFDQLASGLLQRVATDPVIVTGRMPYLDFALENVGRIANRGWELQGAYTAGRLELGGTLSLVGSRVRRIAEGYTGDLRAGDRLLEVPARTTALEATWRAERWTASAGVARAADWINYDRLALAAAYADTTIGPGRLSGDALRAYWRHYGGATRVRASLSRTLFAGLSATVAGENLLGQQRNEPDNATVLPGRSVTVGVRAEF